MTNFRNYFVFTPLLASTCVGTLEFRCITEPIRRFAPQIKYHQAWCTNVKFDERKVFASPTTDLSEKFELKYDKLVIASGAISNTFSIEGVEEHALFLKDISDARKIRHRVLDCFERAMQPSCPTSERKRLLNFAIVGGGPTGVEFAAELHDFVNDDVTKLYSQLRDQVNITVYDVAPRILGAFDVRLGQFASEKFARGGIKVETGTAVAKVGDGWMKLSKGNTVDVGMIIWATGLSPNLLTKSLACEKDQRTGRIFTDDKLRAQLAKGNFDENVYAIGDCSIIKGNELPCTAQVAKQQAQYLAKRLNNNSLIGDSASFTYKPLGMMAYIGGWQAVADMNLPRGQEHKISGKTAWLIWRSAYFSMAVSLKNKILIPMYWFLTWIFGRDISNI